jgi:hypothetical protein
VVFAGAGLERCDAGVTGELGVASEVVDRADLAEQFGCAERAAAGQSEEPRRDRARARVQFAVEFADRAAEGAAAAEQVACDPQVRCLRAAGELAAEPVEPDAAVERPKRHMQRRVKLMEVPAQPRLAAAPLVDEVVAVVDQQLQLAQRLFAGARTVQLRFLQCGACDRERIDRV